MKFGIKFSGVAAKAKEAFKRGKSIKPATVVNDKIEAVKAPGLDTKKHVIVLVAGTQSKVPPKVKEQSELESVTVSEATTSTAPSVTHDEVESDLSSNSSEKGAKSKVARGLHTLCERKSELTGECDTNDGKERKLPSIVTTVETNPLFHAKSGVSDWTDSAMDSDGSLVSRRTIPESIAAMQIKRIRNRHSSTDSAFTEISEVDSNINYDTIIPDLKNLLIRADSLSSSSGGSSSALPLIGQEDMWTSQSLPLATLRRHGKEPATPASSCPSTSRSTRVVRHILSRVQAGGDRSASEEVVLRAIRRLFSNDPVKQRSGVQMMQHLFGKEVGLLVVSIVALYARSRA